MESWVQSWLPRANAFCLFSIPPRPCEARSYEVLHLSRKIILISKREDLILQNTTRLRKSARWPPNISDEHVSCIAPATRNASLQILFKSPVRLPHKTALQRPKSAPRTVCFAHFDFEMCFAPQLRALFQHLNFQNCSENGVLSTFWLRNMLRAATACTFWTSQLPKVLREWCALHILTSKCASRRNCVHFFNTSTSKSSLIVVCV